MNDKILIATHGSQGIILIRELYSLGYDNNNINIITTDSANNQPFISFLNFINAEYSIIEHGNHLSRYIEGRSYNYLISVSFKFIFSEHSLKNIKDAAINFHPGILPEYRGSFSVPWSIINNEKYVGYTYHLMTKNVDKGKIILQEKFPVNRYNAHTLHYLLFQDGLRKLGVAIDNAKNTIDIDKVVAKGNSGKFYYNKLPFGGEINKSWDHAKIERFIRAMYFPPHPPAFISINNKKIYCKSMDDYLAVTKDLI